MISRQLAYFVFICVVSIGNIEAQNNIIDMFGNPDVDAKPMLRWWFPSADYEEDLVRQQIQDVFNAGFGGVEIALVPHYTVFDASVDGWGTEKWKELMKFILKEAQSLPSPFKVDFTITAHWPPSLNTIDPNDAAASQELSYTYQKAEHGKNIRLNLPETKTKDRDGTSFIFVDKFVAASVARVESIKGDQIILDESSLKDVSQFVSKIKTKSGKNKFAKAGIPEDATTFGNKPKLNDKQFYYEVKIPKSVVPSIKQNSNSEIQEGDWLLFTYYHRGTGQSISGMGMMHLFLPMADGMYATGYYNSESSDAITDFWNKNLLNDPELVALLKKGKGDLFEDSIESFSVGAYWTHDFLEEFYRFKKYNLEAYLPFIVSLKGSKLKFDTQSDISKRVQEDYHETLNDLYINEHVKLLQNWTKSFGYGYRAQAYGASIETSGASAVLDVSEGESLGFGSRYDQFRNIAGGVHMANKKFVSDEILADLGMAYKLSWKSAASTLNSNFAAGVNRAIFHGTSYPKEPSGRWNDWPGWHPFQAAFAEPWDRRQIFWDDVDNIANFVARSQAILQNGQPQIDIAIYKSQLEYGYGFEELMDRGYSYDVIGTTLLLHENAVVLDDRFSPANYKALIVNDASTISYEAANKLLTIAQTGFPIVIYGTLPQSLIGLSGEQMLSFTTSPADLLVKEKMTDLLKFDNVVLVKEGEILSALKELGVHPNAHVEYNGIQTLCRKSPDSSLFYFIYNSTGDEIQTSIELKGEGKPYLFDPWTGNISPIHNSSTQKMKSVVDIQLAAQESVFIGLGKWKLESEPVTLAHNTENTIDLKKWDLTIESWGPAQNQYRPYESDKTNLELGKICLTTWDKLDISKNELSKAGVNSADNISGVGNYSTSFNMKKKWETGQPAYLKMVNSDDMVVSVEVNGHLINNINPLSNTIDIGPYLKRKKNFIEIKLATTLIKRVQVEHEIFKSGFAFPPPPENMEGAGEGPPPDMPPLPQIRSEFSYGLTDVIIKY